MTTITVYGEFEPDPLDEEMWENLQPIEVNPYNGKLVFRYYTPEEAALKDERIARMERLQGPRPKKTKIIKDDTYYALYESDLEEDERPPLEVEPHLEERDLEPIIFLTQEDRDLYIGSDDSQDAKSQLLASPAKNDEGMIPKEDMNLDANVNLEEELAPTRPLAPNLAPQSVLPQVHAHRIECEYEFKLKPGDVMIFLELRTEGKPPDPFGIQRYIEVHKDINYFEDMGQYRVNFMDAYGPLYDGDMVVRFGNFGRYYNWYPRQDVNCYVYFIDVKPLGDGDPPYRPWYWIEDLHLKQPFRSIKGSMAIPNPVAQNTPIREVVPDFALRYGDILMTHVWDTKLGHFDRMKSYAWNPLLASIGMDKFINHEDRVLRYGFSYHKVLVRRKKSQWVDCVVEIHVELYSFRKTSIIPHQGEWLFLGRSTKRFDDHLSHDFWTVGKVKEPHQVPLAGDILFDRGLRFAVDLDPVKRMGPPRLWYSDFNIGGLVSFYTWEYYKFFGKDPRPYDRLTDKGKYGVGNTTMALRFGTFTDPKVGPDSPIWTWRERNTVELYVINTRGSSWRRVAVSNWPFDMPRPLPNYNWKPHNPSNIEEVPRSFKPQAGDVIIRLTSDPEWVRMKADPLLVGTTYNPHYDVNIQMGICDEDSTEFQQGDYLVRAGYETNEINPTWTNATVELYYMEGKESWLNTKSPWKFRGRDAFVFGTDSWRPGALDAVEESGIGNMSVSDVGKLNAFDRTEFVKLDPSEVWREKGFREANRIGPEWQ